MDDYLISKRLWEKDVDGFLDKANLSHFKNFQNRKNDFKKMFTFHFKQSNEHILKGENKHLCKRKSNKYYVVTPKVDKQELLYLTLPAWRQLNSWYKKLRRSYHICSEIHRKSYRGLPQD